MHQPLELSTFTGRNDVDQFSLTTEATIPGWTGCNQLLSKDSHPLNNIGYLPVIDASPTDKSTVNAILEKSLEIANILKLSSIVLVMDQAIYAKAQEIRWQGRPEFREQLILRLGEFHTAMAFLGTIGKRFGDAGLKDVAIESGLVAEGSINGVLSGHHYNRSLRCHKVIYEALHRLRMQDYVDQLYQPEDEEALEVMQTLQNDFVTEFFNVLQTDAVSKFLKQYQEYVDLRCRQNSMYAFWISYLQMVEELLLFLRATREGNWNLHLSTIRDMIPWFFAYGRINYSRYLPVYYLEMTSLPSSHPFVHARLADGEFAVKRHNDHGFSMTACDQVIEQTYNRDSKTRGGLTGITLNKGAVRRWILSHPARAAIANVCYTMSCAKSNTTSSMPEVISSRIRTDEQAVQDVMATITGFYNPFTSEEENKLINISSGKIAPENVRSDLSSAYSHGEECFKTFVNERLIENNKDLYDTLVLPSGKTFSDIDKKVKSKLSLASASMKENRHLLSRLLIVAQEKSLDLKDVLQYPLSSVPPALGNFDGSMSKTNKAALLHELEKLDPTASILNETEMSSETVLIVDAMAMIQQQRQFPDTFGSFAISLLHQLVSMAKRYHATRVDFVADRYLSISTKQYERQQRASQGQTKVHINRPEQKMPKQMKKFLACDSNKEALLCFLVNEWKTCSPDMLSHIQIYATQGEECFKLHKSPAGTVVVDDVPELHSDQEEADTRMFLHAQHASESTSHDTDIIIRTVDTDVFVLAIWVSTVLKRRLVLLLTTGNNAKALDVQKMSKTLGDNIAEALVGLHPFTGCDNVSAFKGKGKVKALKLMMKDAAYIRAFSELGREWTVADVLQQDLEMFVCELYGWKDSVTVNDVRYNCFRFGCVGDTSMPPNSDSLQLHMMRANYQAHVYRSCLQQQISTPTPEGHGWSVTDTQLAIKWNTMPIAPATVLQSVNCMCRKTSCDSTKCSCKKAGIVCTDMCKCENCQNRNVIQDDSDDST